MTEPSSVSTSEPGQLPDETVLGGDLRAVDGDAGACIGARFADLPGDILGRLSELLAGTLESALDAADLRFEGIRSDGIDVDHVGSDVGDLISGEVGRPFRRIADEPARDFVPHHIRGSLVEVHVRDGAELVAGRRENGLAKDLVVVMDGRSQFRLIARRDDRVRRAHHHGVLAVTRDLGRGHDLLARQDPALAHDERDHPTAVGVENEVVDGFEALTRRQRQDLLSDD